MLRLLLVPTYPGERTQRCAELEEDVADMRRIFHAQLDEAVGQLNQARQELAALKQQQQHHSTLDSR